MFGLYPDPAGDAQRMLDAAMAGHDAACGHRPPGRGQSPLACHRRCGRSALSSVLGPKPMFIADGHHRYETACNYREHLQQSAA